MVDEKTNAIDQIVKERDWLVVDRLRLFRLKRAIDAYAQTIDSHLQECVEAGRELRAKIALPIWENVWKTSLEKEMARVCGVSEWTRPEQALQKSDYGPLTFDDVLTFRIGDSLEDCDRQEYRARRASWRRPTLRQLVLDRLYWAGREGSKAAPIRAHAKQILERDFHVKAVGMTLNRLAKEGLARREGHVWFPVGQEYERVENLGDKRGGKFPIRATASPSGRGGAILSIHSRPANVLRRPADPEATTLHPRRFAASSRSPPR